MSPLVVLFAATLLAGTPTHHAAAAPHPSNHTTSSAHQATAQQRTYEQAVHHQMEQERHLIEHQQRAIHEQIHAEMLHQQSSAHPHATTVPSSGTNAVSFRNYAAQPYGLGSSYGGYYHRPYHSYYQHHYYHHRNYHHYSTWPSSEDPESMALLHLRQTLDQVHPGVSATSHQGAIEQALMRVVEVNHAPSVAAINRLAGELNHALATRTSPTIDTGTIALALRGGLNTPALIAAERVEVIRELENALKHGGVHAPQASAVVAALRNVEHQEIARR